MQVRDLSWNEHLSRRFNHPLLPRSIRGVIVGKSGCGKTTLLQRRARLKINGRLYHMRFNFKYHSLFSDCILLNSILKYHGIQCGNRIKYEKQKKNYPIAQSGQVGLITTNWPYSGRVFFNRSTVYSKRHLRRNYQRKLLCGYLICETR